MARRTVTVLFADIADRTALYAGLGGVGARDALVHTQKNIEVAARAAQGWVADGQGDEILAVFEHADNALTAAQTLQTQLFEDNQQRQHPVQLRVAIHTGQALVEQNRVYGDVVNTAAKLSLLSDARQIIVSDAAQKTLNQDEVEKLSPWGEHRVRGKQLHLSYLAGIESETQGSADVGTHTDVSLTTATDVAGQQADATKAVEDDTADARVENIESARLRVKTPAQEFVLDATHPRCTIGRGTENDITISDQRASRTHAEIALCDGRFVLTDRSTNGTYIARHDEAPVVLHREAYTLAEHGVLALGRQPDNATDAARISFEVW